MASETEACEVADKVPVKPGIDFAALLSPGFRPQEYITSVRTHLRNVAGCGPAALILLTGENPLETMLECLNGEDDSQTGTSADMMRRFLEKRGYSVTPVTPEDICNEPERMSTNIRKSHVLLVPRLVAKDAYSWFVSWNDSEWHNLERTPSLAIADMNRPIMNQTFYIIHHPSWKVELGPIFEFLDQNPQVLPRLFGPLKLTMDELKSEGEVSAVDLLKDMRRIIERAREQESMIPEEAKQQGAEAAVPISVLSRLEEKMAALVEG